MRRGDMVTVLPHHLPGYAWTVGAVGSIYAASHTCDFDRLHHPKREPPSVKPGWWVVAVCHAQTKGGAALAQLPEEHLAPHACTERCPKHACKLITG